MLTTDHTENVDKTQRFIFVDNEERTRQRTGAAIIFRIRTPGNSVGADELAHFLQMRWNSKHEKSGHWIRPDFPQSFASLNPFNLVQNAILLSVSYQCLGDFAAFLQTGKPLVHITGYFLPAVGSGEEVVFAFKYFVRSYA